MFHLAAYTASNAAGATDADTPALTDSGVLYITNNHFLFQQPMTLVAAHAMGASLTRARFDSGNVRYYGKPNIEPLNNAAIPGSNPNLMVLWDNPFILPAREEIAMLLSNSAGAPERETVGIWLMPVFEPAPAGPFWAVRFTGTTAVTANAWTIEPFTMEQALPSGTYWMIHSNVQSTNGQFARWFFDTQFWRPGFTMWNALGNRDVDIWRPGILGKMNTNAFVNDRLPALEILANGADASFEGRMFIKPASPPAIGVGGIMSAGATAALPYRAGA